MFSIFKHKTGKEEAIEADVSLKREVSGRNVKEFIQKLEESKAGEQEKYCNIFLSKLAREMEIIQAACYLLDEKSNPPVLRYLTGYACNADYTKELTFAEGEGLPGQALKDKKILKLEDVPEGYITVRTGLGEASPNTLVLIPLMHNERVAGLLELASFHKLSEKDEHFLQIISEHLAEKISEEETI